MSRRYPTQPLVGVGAIIFRDEEVALVRRGGPPSKGKWSIPGGLVELGESLEEALRREVREETGLEVEVLERCAVLERVLRDPWGRVEYHYVLIDFACRYVSGELIPASDTRAAAWVSIEGLDDYTMTSGTAQVIRDAFKRFGQ